MSVIRKKDKAAIIQSLRAGVAPNVGQQHIQVGRADEINELIKDLDVTADGGSAIRFIIGEYGAGKTFFLNLVKSIAREKKLVTVSADLNPDRRLHASGGQARSLFSELMRNMSTRTKQDGGAISSVAERFIGECISDSNNTGKDTSVIIHERIDSLKELVGGYDFATVIECYWKGYDSGNSQLMSDSLRWLRGEFTAKTDARKSLGVRTIVDDANMYDHLKLVAAFVRLAGYMGLLVSLDELVNLYKLPNTQARKSNYEQILRILNDTLQGGVEGLCFIMGGTPEFLSDPRRGLYSYEALHTRLSENSFAKDGSQDLSGPVIRLGNLTQEDLYILLTKIRTIISEPGKEDELIDNDGLESFLDHCYKSIGSSYYTTPRNTIRSFVHLLSMLEQNANLSWKDLLMDVVVEEETSNISLLNEEAAPCEELSKFVL